VLVVDDGASLRTYLANLLELKGYRVDTAGDGGRALTLLEGGADPDLVILDVMMPGIDGIATLRRIRELDARIPVVILSGVRNASTIVEAMRVGAVDYLVKPFDEAELDRVVRQALRARALPRKRPRTRPWAVNTEPVWSGSGMKKIVDVIEQISATDVAVLIQGESGSGKEIVARRLHERSPRASRPFVKVNCAALPAPLLESELFGYEPGAFTGATVRKLGKFELADKGTIFLDEIAEMSPGLQAKLLQVLQDGAFCRLGGNRELRVDVRVICSTHRPLLEMVAQKTFREDLYFRLNVVGVQVPPLRERRDEIPKLADRFLRLYSARYHKPLRPLSHRLLELFERHSFPGNVRELENFVKRFVVLESETSVINELMERESSMRETPSSLSAFLEEMEATAGAVPLRDVGRRVCREVERETIHWALEHTNGNRRQAAKLLHVSCKTLREKMRGCGLEAQ
jgi:DNA-binding NtrC family response regulator